MYTAYRLIPESRTVDLNIERFKALLPNAITLETREDGLFAIVDSAVAEDEATQYLIDRELDRLFFLTCVRLRAEMCRKTVIVDANGAYRVHGQIPENAAPEIWTDRLSLQLRLWALAVDSTDPMVKVLLFFQIIELSFPQTGDTKAYPKYEDEERAPCARTEAKLLRHLVAHAGDARPDTERYLKFLGLPPRLSNLTHPEWTVKVAERIPHVEAQARDVLQSAMKSL